ncbi:SDR family NAD(P)-dependent oxidoreductase [Streptomyces sp. NPDC127068]|uniref:SDR family NAD(P)-dependent oxidoreductase n=1 Tax=Streptomyces sp. NPDC127068 TaxID=3347127 RepID=UPI003648F530
MPITPQSPTESTEHSFETPDDVRAGLAGRSVLITGGSRGFGREMARAFLERGARVLITGRDQDALASTRAELAPYGDLRTAVVDSTDEGALRELAARLLADWGGTDVLVANAGASGPIGPAWENDPAHWWATHEVNVRGTFLTCHAFVPQLLARGGRILVISSNAGMHRWPHLSAYSVSKAAGIKLAENLAAELRPHGVHVFAYHPGLLTIGMSSALMETTAEEDSWEGKAKHWLLRERAQGRTTSTDVGVRGALLLAAGVADHLTGQYLTSDHPDLTWLPALPS